MRILSGFLFVLRPELVLILHLEPSHTAAHAPRLHTGDAVKRTAIGQRGWQRDETLQRRWAGRIGGGARRSPPARSAGSWEPPSASDRRVFGFLSRLCPVSHWDFRGTKFVVSLVGAKPCSHDLVTQTLYSHGPYLVL